MLPLLRNARLAPAIPPVIPSQLYGSAIIMRLNRQRSADNNLLVAYNVLAESGCKEVSPQLQIEHLRQLIAIGAIPGSNDSGVISSAANDL